MCHLFPLASRLILPISLCQALQYDFNKIISYSIYAPCVLGSNIILILKIWSKKDLKSSLPKGTQIESSGARIQTWLSGHRAHPLHHGLACLWSGSLGGQLLDESLQAGRIWGSRAIRISTCVYVWRGDEEAGLGMKRSWTAMQWPQKPKLSPEETLLLGRLPNCGRGAGLLDLVSLSPSMKGSDRGPS